MKTLAELKAREARVMGRVRAKKESRNCGTGAGGFKNDNTCAKGGDYRGQHEAPDRESGSPMHNVVGAYPDDVYSANALKYYGTEGQNDALAISVLHGAKGNPAKEISVYRAVPLGSGGKINPGDWVAITRSYARAHGLSVHGKGGFVVLSIKVPAKHLFTDGNSLQEWGYDPSEESSRSAEPRNCGTGKGGFQPGNKCAADSQSGYPGGAVAEAPETIDARGDGASRVAGLLNDGHNVIVRASDLDKLFRKMAARDDDPDITNLVIHGTTLFGGEGLGIPRSDMPQFGETQEAFLQHLREQGITTDSVEISPLTLRPIQKEISGRRAGNKYIKAVKKGAESLGRIVISRDGYVVDGHHRWAAAVALASSKPSTKVVATVLGTDNQNALRMSLDWTRANGLEGKAIDARALAAAADNCGTGKGGFQPGNTCASGGDGGELYELTRAEIDAPFDGKIETHFKEWSKARDSWESAVKAAVSEGKITVEEANAKTPRGYVFPNSDIIEKLPDTLFHVTVAGDKVEAEGLKTPRQRSGGSEGLGGGDPNAVSLTTSERVARGIYDGMLEAKDVLDGKITPADLIAQAKTGGWLAKLEDWVQGHYALSLDEKFGATVVVKDETPQGAALMGLATKAEVDPAWKPYGEPYTGHADGAPRWRQWLRPATPQEQQEAAFNLYRANSLHRETATGQYDPYFGFNDLEAFAAISRDQIRIYKASPATAKSMGQKIAGPEAEYRVFSGRAVTLERAQ